ncbi:sulfotransferase family protein, partial [Shimia sp.]|uniref:sulfotransferase family protein n=1 Tax=Shimia sp. TaxID=1954381 RepID=UPI0035665174
FPKVFGIGFQKTGTTTLLAVFRALGYHCKDYGKELIPSLARGDLQPAFEIADQYDAFEDNPWPLIYRELDQRYPGSKFILTIRDEESWIKSVVNHLGYLPDPMQTLVYGVGFPAGYEDVFLARYRRHNEEVQAHFADRPEDLLVVDFAAGQGWPEICAFLGREVPDLDFPHEFKGSYSAGKSRSRRVASRVVHGLRRLGGGGRRADG